MRKVDYNSLAEIINQQVKTSHTALSMARNDSEKLQAQTIRYVAETIAKEFAQKAHVDKAVFLRQCGITA